MLPESIRPRKNSDIVKDVKKLKAEGEEFEEFTTGGGAVLKKMFVQRVYGDSPPGQTWAKEVTQNILDSFDMRRDETKDPRWKGRAKISFDTESRTLRADDNGIGMSPEFMREHFLNPGDSGKREGAYRGNFGIAKLALFGFGDPFEVTSRWRDPATGEVWQTKVRGNGMTWIGDSKAEISKPVKLDKGTDTGLKIKVVLDNDIAGFSNVTTGQLMGYLRSTLSSGMLVDKIDVVMDGIKEDIPKGKNWKPDYGEAGREGKGEWVDDPYTKKKKIDKPEATYEISYEPARPGSETSTVFVELYNRGQFQSGRYDNNMRVSLNEPVAGLPSKIRVNVLSKVDGTHKDYPWEFDRKNLKGNGKQTIDNFLVSLTSESQTNTMNRYREAERASPKVKGTSIRVMMPEYDMRDPEVRDVVKSISENPVYAPLAKALRTVTKKFLDTVGVEMKGARGAKVGLGYFPERYGTVTFGMNAPAAWYGDGLYRIIVSPWSALKHRVVPNLNLSPKFRNPMSVEATEIEGVGKYAPDGWLANKHKDPSHIASQVGTVKYHLRDASYEVYKTSEQRSRFQREHRLLEFDETALDDIRSWEDAKLARRAFEEYDSALSQVYDRWRKAKEDANGFTGPDIQNAASELAYRWVEQYYPADIGQFIRKNSIGAFKQYAEAWLQRQRDAAGLTGNKVLAKAIAETNLDRLAAMLAATSLHEVTHNWARNHNETFAGQLTQNMALGLMLGTKAYKPLAKALADPKVIEALLNDEPRLAKLTPSGEELAGAVSMRRPPAGLKATRDLSAPIRQLTTKSLKAEGERYSAAPEARKALDPKASSLISAIRGASPDKLREMVTEYRPEIVRSLRRGLRRATKDTDWDRVGIEELRQRKSELPPDVRELVERMDQVGARAEEIDHQVGVERYDPLWERLGAPRAIITSLDLSGILRQGIVGTARLGFTKPTTLVRAINNSIKALASEKEFAKGMQAIEGSTDYRTLKALGVDFARTEEQFGGAKYVEGIFKKITGGRGNFVRMSERAYTYYLNRLRYELGKKHLDSLRKLGFDGKVTIDPKGRAMLSGKDLKVYQNMAEWINIATGRGSLPKGQDKLSAAVRSADKFLNMVFFSPRLMLARVALLNPFTYGGAFAEMRRAQGSWKAARAMASMHIGDLIAYTGLVGGVMAGMQALFPDAEFESDMTSSDFGQIRMGNTRADVTGGVRTYITAVARLLTGTTKTEYGTVKPQPGSTTIANFLRGKLGPVPGLIMTMAEGQNIVGDPAYGPLKDVLKGDEPITPEVLQEILRTTGGTLAESTVMPMILSDAMRLMRENDFDPVQIAALLGIATLGVGVSTREVQPGLTKEAQQIMRRVKVGPMQRPSMISTPFRNALGKRIELKLPYMVRKHLEENSDKSFYEILDRVVSRPSFQRLPPAAQRIVVVSLLTDARQARSPRAMAQWGRERMIPKVMEQRWPKELRRLEPPPSARIPRERRATDVKEWTRWLTGEEETIPTDVSPRF
jgi:hypothetical protein